MGQEFEQFELLQFCIGDRGDLEAVRELSVDEPFSAGRIAFLNEISRELLSDREAKAYPDVVTFAYWVRRANMERQRAVFLQENTLRVGRGVVFHIAPSNVAVNYAYSFAAGFVLGNANIVRLPSRAFPQVEIINRAIRAVLARRGEWAGYVIFLRYPRERRVNDYLSSLCDVRVIWGGDETIHEVRKSELPPRAGEVTFADRYSICVADSRTYLGTEDKDAVALGFYNDTYLTDQNACTSPMLVCWTGGEAETAEAQKQFWSRLWQLVSRRYTAQPVQFVNKLTSCCLVSAAVPGCRVVRMPDHLITRVELERLTPEILRYRENSGFFFEYRLSDIMELRPLCGTKLQTVACLGNSEMLLHLVRSGVKGIDRIVPVGHTMDFDFIWDGYDLTERMTRRIFGCS